MSRRLAAIIRKEFTHIGRDFRSLIIVLIMPVLMIVLYGYGITLDMRSIPFAVFDDARTPESRSLIRAFSENGFFSPTPVDPSEDTPEHLFRTRKALMILVLPADFSAALASGEPAQAQILVDAGDSNVGAYVQKYSSEVLRAWNQSLNPPLPVPMRLEPRFLYNPDMKSTHFFVPGLIALLLMLISALLTSITITRERETGTLEQILVTPVRPFEIVAGKVLPYIVIGFANGALVLISARLLFGVPVNGSLLLLSLLSLVYIFVALSFGLLISTVARTQQTAMFITVMATILPTFLLSGFIFPISGMPPVLQYLSRVIPATYFLTIIRGIMLKGVGLTELWPQAAALTGIGIFLLAVATRRFRLTLE